MGKIYKALDRDPKRVKDPRIKYGIKEEDYKRIEEIQAYLLQHPDQMGAVEGFIEHLKKEKWIKERIKEMIFRFIITLAVSAYGATALASGSKQTEPETLDTYQERLSYAVGLDVGANLRLQEINLDQDNFMQGFKDGIAGTDKKLTDEQLQETLTRFRQEITTKRQEQPQQISANNVQAEKDFFAQNQKKEGVKTLESGLQYEVIESGDGKQPKLSDTVTVHYIGKLLDGTVFDSSEQRGTSATFPVTGVIAGWTEALQLMKEGDKWRLYIPSALAYGERGSPPSIGPSATLIFDVNLISVN